MKKLETIINDDKKTVGMHNDTISIGEVNLTIRPRDMFGYEVKNNTHTLFVEDIIQLENGKFRVEISGFTVDVSVIDPINLAFTSGDEQKGDIIAPMAGQISKILVKPGDKVNRGDVLLIISAMKMENQITSPIDGKVRRIHVSSGNGIDSGKLLIELEQDTT
ncbi:MAG: biotin/lipoyl-containing protein [Candidatus Kariarchaeaceae archaeon]|jgi:biotin carboxyl carrier protein